MIEAQCLLHGIQAGGPARLTVRNPFNQEPVGTVALGTRALTEAAITACLDFTATPSRYERAQILEGARAALETRREEFARLITPPEARPVPVSELVPPKECTTSASRSKR